jgi:hypothetical protein
MRLNVEHRATGSAVEVVFTGILDWSTLSQFGRAMDALVCGAQPRIRLDLTGLIPWSPEARVLLRRAVVRARLCGREVTVSELPSIPRWEAGATRSPESAPARAEAGPYSPMSRPAQPPTTSAGVDTGLRLVRTTGSDPLGSARRRPGRA